MSSYMFVQIQITPDNNGIMYVSIIKMVKTKPALMLHWLFYCMNVIRYPLIQYNLKGSNTDGSFTLDDSNSFFSPYKILPIAQENKYLGIFSYFIMALYVVCTH